MARLYHHRAVAAISGGEDIALEQARKALEFAPRDAGLQASVKELEALADGKREIRDVLPSWGQRAKENNRRHHLSLHRIDVFNINRATVTEEYNKDREANCSLCSGNR